jgi:hypothetical protein
VLVGQPISAAPVLMSCNTIFRFCPSCGLNVIALALLVECLIQLQFAPAALGQKRMRQLEARQVLPGEVPAGSRVHAVTKDPKDLGKLFAATTQALMASDNGGKSWRSLEVGGKHEETFAVALHPSNPQILFVGRRDGLWRSDDGGTSWVALSHSGSVPLAIAVSDSHPDTLYLGTAGTGVDKSVDGGYHWVAISKGLPEGKGGGRAEVPVLVVDASDSDTVYASFLGWGIYRSVDGGASWHEFNQGIGLSITRTIISPKLGSNPDDPKRLFLAFNERVHSHLVQPRLYVLENQKWWPLVVKLPANFLIRHLVVERTRRTIQFWGADAVWEIPLPENSAKQRGAQ